MDTRIQALQQKIVQSEQVVNLLKKQLSILKSSSSSAALDVEEKNLRSENETLKKRVEELKNRLCQLESARGLAQVSLPSINQAPVKKLEASKESPAKLEMDKAATSKADASKEAKNVRVKEKKEKKEKPQPAKTGGGDATAGGETVDVSRLDFRIGKIVEVKYHPDAESLYVETVDVGEERPRTILSGLVKHVPINEMQDRRAVFLCNLKPAKMRGIASEGMIMCASTSDGLEIIGIPDDAIPGDIVSVEGYPRKPDVQLNPKKKIFEKLKPDLLTDAKGFATYKGAKWLIEGKGYCQASLVNAQIS